MTEVKQPERLIVLSPFGATSGKSTDAKRKRDSSLRVPAEIGAGRTALQSQSGSFVQSSASRRTLPPE
jgi:hypothetical protein